MLTSNFLFAQTDATGETALYEELKKVDNELNLTYKQNLQRNFHLLNFVLFNIFTAGNIGFCNIGADGITMSICNSIWHLFGQTSFNLAFCCYLHQQFFNWASVPGGRFSNPPTSQSPIVGGNAAGSLLLQRSFIL